MDKSELEKLLKKREEAKEAPPQPHKATAPKSPLEPLVDTEVTLEGVARDAALGPLLKVDGGGQAYLEGLDSWPNEASGKRVRASGMLRRKKIAPDPTVGKDGAVSHGMVGTALVLENPTWNVLS